jgi:hypothetical protein
VTETVDVPACDDVWSFFDECMKDPKFARIYAERKAKYDRAEQRLCAFGNCVMEVDPVDERVLSGVGPVGCGCEWLPGWRSQRYGGKAKPGWPAKPFGRHGGRIAASRRKHAKFAREQAEFTRAMAD